MRSLYLILASFALAHGHLSASTLEAEKFLKKAVTEVAQIADHSQNSSALAASVRPVLMNVISFELMTRRAVGPGWREFTEAQKKEAESIITELNQKVYDNKIVTTLEPFQVFYPAENYHQNYYTNYLIGRCLKKVLKFLNNQNTLVLLNKQNTESYTVFSDNLNLNSF